MSFLAIILIVLLALLTISSIIVAVLIIGLSRRISDIQKRSKIVHDDIASAMSLVSIVASVTSFYKGVSGEVRKRRMKKDSGSGKTN